MGDQDGAGRTELELRLYPECCWCQLKGEQGQGNMLGFQLPDRGNEADEPIPLCNCSQARGLKPAITCHRRALCWWDRDFAISCPSVMALACLACSDRVQPILGSCWGSRAALLPVSHRHHSGTENPLRVKWRVLSKLEPSSSEVWASQKLNATVV